MYFGATNSGDSIPMAASCIQRRDNTSDTCNPIDRLQVRTNSPVGSGTYSVLYTFGYNAAGQVTTRSSSSSSNDAFS